VHQQKKQLEIHNNKNKKIKKIMAFKLKGQSMYSSSVKSHVRGHSESQADKAKKVVARNTGDSDALKGRDVQDISAVQEDKKGNKFVVSLKDNESYSGDDENPITTGYKGSKYVDRTASRDTFMVSKNYPKGSLIDETEMETGKSQKEGFVPRKKNY